MRKNYLLLVILLIVGKQSMAQLTGTKTIPGNYATIAAAVTDLNAQGVGAGGVTFNVAAGHTETSDIAEITATGTLANQIVFQKSGAGANPLITRLTAGTIASTTTLGSDGDGIIIINGGDYITFDGIDVQTNAAFSGSGMMEYGYYLKKFSATNACKNVTIRNCTITLNRAAIYSFGVFVSNISGTISVTVTSTGGRSENIKLYGLTITNAYGGIQLRGYAAATPYDFYDQNAEIGVGGANSITNYGGGATTTYGIYGIYQNNLIIANNTINNTANGGAVTTTTFYGIFLSTGTNSNVEIHHNTISITAGGTTSTTYAINNAMGATGTNNLVSIHDNAVTSCSYPTSTSGSLYLIYQSTSPYTAHIYNNTVTGNSVTSTSGTLYCIYQSGSVVNEGKIYGNTISGNTKTGTGTMYGIYNSPATTSTNDIYNNTISGNSGGGTLQGIYQGAGLVTNIFKNQVFNQSSSGATGVVNGMTVVSGPLTTNIFNNFISDLKSPAGDAVTDGVRGIYITSTTASSSINLDYNTIYLNATSSGVNFSVSGVYHTYNATATSASLTMRNNIIVNASTPNGTGIVSAFRRSASTSLVNFNNATNNNDYYAGTPAANRLIFYDGTNSDLTLAAYKARVAPRDINAISELPPFVNVATTPYDLHINTTIATQVESGGTPVAGITDDIDGNARNATSPDIGADEFTGIAADLSGPSISYTTLGYTSCLTDRTLAPVTITDPSGVNITAGTRPRLYYKKASNSNTFVDNTNATDGWKFTEATGAGGSPFSLTTDYSLLFGGAPIIGDAIQYFVVAQDNASTPNVGINAGSFAATPASVALTAAAFPIGGTTNSYNITPVGLSGTVNVGAAETFKSLTEVATATGVFANINANGLSGNTTIVLMDASITETGATALNTIASSGCSGGPYTLLIKPNTTTTLTGSVASGALLKLNGADNVTIDGSNNGSSSRDLTITNTATTAPTVLSLISLGTGSGATNNTIKNCNISTGVQTSIGYGISVGGSTPGTPGADNDNVTIQNNNITNCAVGIYAIGTAAVSTGGDDNLNILSNSIFYNETLANVIAIRIGQTLNSTVSTNTVNVETTASVGIAGISLETGTNNTLVSRNLISKVKSTNSSASSIARGIVVGTAQTGSAITISNNVIYNVLTSWPSSTVGYGHAGIFLGSIGASTTFTTIAGGVNLFFNSVYLSGNADRSLSTVTYALYVGSGVSSVDCRNNAFQNSTVNVNAGGTASKSYSIYSVAANTAYTTINYNDYYVSGAQGVTGFISSDRVTLADIQAGFGQNVNSLVADPLFNSSTNLIPLPGSPLLAAGDNSTGITIDYLGIARGNPPTIGAYEQSVDQTGPAITYTPFGNTLCINDRTLTPVTITDATGVNTTAGTKPRLYFKKTTNTNTFNDNTNATDGWKYVEATNASSPFSFTTIYSLVNGGVALGNIIQYFVVAQDLVATPNVSINSGIFNAAPSSVALTAAAFPVTGTINQYTLIAGGLAADVTIGGAGTYLTVTGAGGLFEAINNTGLVNNITARILDPTLTEDGTNSLNAINFGCSGSSTLLIKPDVGITTLLSGTGATALINLNGADNVTIDGSNNGSSSKDMTIRNISTAGATIRFVNDATFNTVKNCKLEGATTSTTSGVVAFSTSTGTTGNSNNSIMNNDIRDRSDVLGAFANSIYSSGSAGALNASNTISGNNLFNFTANGMNLTATGIGNGWSITNNNLFNNLATPPATTQNGILIAGGTGHTVSGNFVGGNAAGATGTWTNTGNVIVTGISITGGVASIDNNTIANITATNTGTTARIRGIANTSGGTSGIVINANTIYNLSSFGAIASYTGGSQPVIGIYTFPGTTWYVSNITNNSIHDLVAENTTALTTTNLAVGMLLTNWTGECYKNTIYNIKNKSTGTTAGQPPVACGIYARFMGPGAVYNNFISLGFGETNNVQYNGVIIVGAGTAGNNQYYYYNSIRIGGTATGTFSSHGFVRGDNSATSPTHPVELKNNILSMERTGGGSVNYAIASQGTGAATDWVSDYNDLYNVSASDIGFWNATGYDFTNWKINSAGDANSISVAPAFTSSTDLHLTAANCGIDGRGVPVAGITTDIDAAVRNTGAPDIGADEFTGTLGTTLAVTVPGTTDIVSYNVSPTGTVFSNSACGIVDGLLPNGGSPVSGLITSKVTIDATVQSYGGNAYVQRHFDITPAVNQATATARVTLYVLQSEFDSYNAANGADPDLPTGPADGTGIANLRVIKYSGNGTAPGNYVPGVATQINPDDVDIVWDATNSWWTITFDVTGFSGFYIAGSFGALPVSLLNFSGYKDGTRNQLRWTTSSESNNRGFEVQRSTDGINYTTLGFVNTLALGGNSTSQLNYTYTDNNVTGSRQYYRLRQVNFDGNSKLSNIVLIKGDKPVSLTIDGLFPNPANSLVNVLIAAPNKDKVTMVITDIAGRTMLQKVVGIETGSNTIPVDISTLANGTYMVKLVCSSNCDRVVGKFVKQ